MTAHREGASNGFALGETLRTPGNQKEMSSRSTCQVTLKAKPVIWVSCRSCVQILLHQCPLQLTCPTAAVGCRSFCLRRRDEASHWTFNMVCFLTALPVFTVNPCELHCRPENEFFAEKLRDAVIDGTSCSQGNSSRDMCINGICKVGRAIYMCNSAPFASIPL